MRRKAGLGVALALTVGTFFLAGCGDDTNGSTSTTTEVEATTVATTTTTTSTTTTSGPVLLLGTVESAGAKIVNGEIGPFVLEVRLPGGLGIVEVETPPGPIPEVGSLVQVEERPDGSWVIVNDDLG